MQNLDSNSKAHAAIQEALHLLKDHFSIQRVFLFGSQAQNTTHRDSDYDLVLVAKDSLQNPFERRVQARTLLRTLHVSFDVFVYTSEEFEKLKNDFGSIAETAMSTGREIDFV